MTLKETLRYVIPRKEDFRTLPSCVSFHRYDYYTEEKSVLIMRHQNMSTFSYVTLFTFQNDAQSSVRTIYCLSEKLCFHLLTADSTIYCSRTASHRIVKH
jgi:hypothetical protein